MGLWLKCPGCQAQNPLSVKVCSQCGNDLDKLSAQQRVYVIGPAAAPSPAPSPAAPVSPEPAAATVAPPAAEAVAGSKPAKKPKRVKKKKS